MTQSHTGAYIERIESAASTEAIPCPIHFHADSAPEAIALRTGSRAWSYADLDARIHACAGRLRRAGLRSGDTVGIQPVDRVQSIVLLFAGMRTGLSTALFSTRLPAQAMDSACAATRVSARVSTDSADDGDEPGLELSASIRTRRPVDDSDRDIPVHIDGSLPATRMYTSGSTGEPRVAVHSAGAHFGAALASASRIPLGPDDRWLLSLPLYHVGGLAVLFRCFCARATVVVPDEGGTLHADLMRYGITHVSLVPTQLRRLLSSTGEKPRSLTSVLVGGGHVPADLIRDAVRAGLPIRTTYGLTEMASQVATSDVWTEERAAYTAGHLLSGCDLRIATGGEICVRGDGLFLGYQDGVEWRTPVDVDGWFATGDIGTLTEEGLVVSGRVDSMFVSGGENIQPEEIEASLLTLDGVTAAMVVSVPDVEFGRRPAAFVDGDADEAEIRRRLVPLLPGFKIPVAVFPWPGRLDPDSVDLDSVDPGTIKPRRAVLQSLAERLIDGNRP